MSPRYGLDGKRAEKGPSTALPGGLQASDVTRRTCSVVLVLLSVPWVVVGTGGSAGQTRSSATAAAIPDSSALVSSGSSSVSVQRPLSPVSPRSPRPVTTHTA